MDSYPIPENEAARLQALYEYEILDTLSEEEYDAITRIAAQLCNVPASLITFLDRDRQWFKSHLGVDMRETPRTVSFCNYTIMDPANVLVVPDMREDSRFSQNPLVTGEPHAVFYAGAPLVTPDGYVLGSICLLDGKANDLTGEQRTALRGLAQQVVARLELQKKLKELSLTQEKLQKANTSLRKFAHIASHDMKTPLANILLVTRSYKKLYEAQFDEHAHNHLDLIEKSTEELLSFIDDVLVQSESIGEEPNWEVDSRHVINKVIDLIAPPPDIEIVITGEFPKVAMNSTSLQQIFQNLITNAIKYNDKEKGVIAISCDREGAFYCFSIADNGSGIEKRHLGKIFEERQTLDKTDRFGNKGTGIGLATVKDIVEAAGGQIKVTSKKNTGSVFKILIPVPAA